MVPTPAFAQLGGAGDGPQALIMQLALPAVLLVLFYFLMIRPQQQRAKQQAAKLGGMKRGDTVVLNSGVTGQITRVDDTEVSVEIAKGVEVRVVKAMVSDVRTKGTPVPANDGKTAKI